MSGDGQGGHKLAHRRLPLVAWWELVGSLGPTWLGPKAPWSSFVREKHISGFYSVWTPFQNQI